MPDVVMFADTLRSPELRHEVPLLAPDPLDLRGAERDAARLRRVARGSAARGDRRAAVARVRGPRQRRADRRRARPRERELELVAARLPQGWASPSATVPRTFPLAVADHLRATGRRARRPTAALFDRRRRVKTEAELAGIRRAVARDRARVRAREGAARPGPADLRGPQGGDQPRLRGGRACAVPDPPLVSHGAADDRRPRSGLAGRSRPASPSCSTSFPRIPSRAASRT